MTGYVYRGGIGNTCFLFMVGLFESNSWNIDNHRFFYNTTLSRWELYHKHTTEDLVAIMDAGDWEIL